MSKLNPQISKHAKDLIQKYASGLFKDATLEFYGIKTAKIKELINIELPAVEVTGSSSDFVFLLEDNSYLHYEFESTYNKKDLIRFAGYDLRLFERDGRFVNTVIIYTADVKEAPGSLNIGSLVYNPNKVMMYDYDGDSIYTELTEKIKNNRDLTDVDMLNLIFLPLMRNRIPKDELAVKSVELAQTIADATKRDACIAAAFAFASRYLNEEQAGKLLEVLKMTDLATMLIEESMQEGMQKGMQKGIQEGAIKIARNALKAGLAPETICSITGLDEAMIERIQAELNNE